MNINSGTMDSTENKGNPVSDQASRDGAYWNALRNVVDPELHMNIVDLGLVYGVEHKEGTVDVRMTLTSPGCPYGPYILNDVDQALKKTPGVEHVNVDVVWEPPWGPEKMTEEAKLELGFDL